MRARENTDDEDDNDKNDPDNMDVDEETLLQGSKVHKSTKEERIEIAREDQHEHKYHDRMADKTAGFSNKEKLKNKPFRLTRFRTGAGHNKMKSLSAVQKQQKKREGILKMRYS